ncbi:lectin-like [Topomyia yanbarensis]|uniref:lectin-like n=1 Tax=Topomyia yanbarensis TaxID=2498891 RepID=UPI00273CD588|nr:lectin-like [Topomyia yanbarensis]
METLVPLLLILTSVCCFAQDLRCISESPYFIPELQANWFKATEYCNSMGMRLAVITSEEANKKAILTIQSANKFNPTSTEIWIGGSDLAKEGEYIWQPTGKRFEYNFWAKGEPNNSGGVENCAQIRYVSAAVGWHWNDKNCDLERYFICENAEPKRVVVVF